MDTDDVNVNELIAKLRALVEGPARCRCRPRP